MAIPFIAVPRAPIDAEQYASRLGGDGARALGYRKGPMPRRAVDTRVLHDTAGVEEDLSRPLLYGDGPPEASTCTGLVRTGEVIWDVNGYYRMLGFGWPFRPTRKELLAAFKTWGHDPPVVVAYAFKLLWHPATRAAYDRAPPGEPFFDELVDQAVKRDAKIEAGRRSAREGREVKAEEVLDDWGLTLDEEPGTDPALVDDDPPEESEPDEDFWPWSFYLWRSTRTATERLQLWQSMLIAEFAIHGIQRKFSVGYFGKQPHRWVTVRVGTRLGILLNEDDEPTSEMARQAVGFVRQDQLG